MPYLEFVLHPQVRPATVERRPGIVGRTEIDPRSSPTRTNAAVTCSGAGYVTTDVERSCRKPGRLDQILVEVENQHDRAMLGQGAYAAGTKPPPLTMATCHEDRIGHRASAILLRRMYDRLSP